MSQFHKNSAPGDLHFLIRSHYRCVEIGRPAKYAARWLRKTSRWWVGRCSIYSGLTRTDASKFRRYNGSSPNWV